MGRQDVGSLTREIRTLLEHAMSKISELEELISEIGPEPPEHLIAKLKVLKRVKDAGGVVSKEDLRDYWCSLGKDPRGFGGLFQGHAKLVLIAGDKVALSPEAEELLKKYEKWLAEEEKTT